MSEMTCANCPHMRVLQIPPLPPAATCSKRNCCLVPHKMISEDETICFWRIPLECPRTDVTKGENKPAHKHWVTKSFSDLSIVSFKSTNEMQRYLDTLPEEQEG